MRALDIAGQRYGRLVAIRREPAGRHTKWLFRCDCGNEALMHLDAVRAGRSTSCGCLRTEQIRERSLTHGHRVDRKTSRTLKAYQHAKSRCENHNDPKFLNYGGRGITMCREWREDFQTFLRDMGECPPRMTLDRVNVDGHYEPRNCRWTSHRQQARTRTNNVLVEFEGRQVILKDFAALMGVNYKALHARVKYRGQTPAEAAAALQGV